MLVCCLTGSNCIHACVLITIFLTWSIIVRPPIINETAPSGSGAISINCHFFTQSSWWGAHFQSFWFDRKWQHVCYYSRFSTVSFNVSRQMLGGCFESKPWRSEESTLSEFIVQFLTSRCHLTFWPPRGFFPSMKGTLNIAQYGSRVCYPWPNHRSPLGLR